MQRVLLLVEDPVALDLGAIGLDEDGLDLEGVSLHEASDSGDSIVVLADHDELVSVHVSLPLSHQLSDLLLNFNPVTAQLELRLLGLERGLVANLDLVALVADHKGHGQVGDHLEEIGKEKGKRKKEKGKRKRKRKRKKKRRKKEEKGIKLERTIKVN